MMHCARTTCRRSGWINRGTSSSRWTWRSALAIALFAVALAPTTGFAKRTTITSVPKGAEVLVSGRVIGRTPLEAAGASESSEALVPMTNVSAISGASAHVCALTGAGRVKCWGYNGSGGLGDGSTTDRLLPAEVGGLTGAVAQVSAAGHSCALTTDGELQCWGDNYYGQIGDGTTITRLGPVRVIESGVASISVGTGANACVRIEAGGVKCWGHNDYGAVGDGTTVQRLTPVDIAGLADGAVSLSGGGFRNCATTSLGGAKCWGYNSNGELGDDSTMHRLEPTDVSGLTSGIAAASTGGYHSCALTTSGGVKCWGANNHGQLGDGSVDGSLTPVDVTTLASGVAALSVGHMHSCALTTSGAVKCWGSNTDGQLGDGSTTNRLEPVEVMGLDSGIAAISAGVTHSCALTTTGGVQCWGGNATGQLGDGTTTNRLTPGPVLERAKLRIDLAVTGQSATPVREGTHLTYTVTARNEGDTVLTNVVASGALLLPPDTTTTCAVVEPGASCVLTGQYPVTRADYLNGQAVNNAVASSDQAGNVSIERVTVLDIPRASQATLPTAAAATGLSVTTNGEYVVTTAGPQVYRLLNDFSVKHALTIGSANSAVNAAAIQPDGSAYLASDNTFLFAFTPQGVSFDHWPRPLGSRVAESLAVDPQGVIFACPMNGIAQAISSTNALLGSLQLAGECAASPLLLPQVGLAILATRSGDLAIVSTIEFEGNQLRVEERTFLSSPPATPLSAVDASRFVWVDDAGHLNLKDALSAGPPTVSAQPVGLTPEGSVLTFTDGRVLVAGVDGDAGLACTFSASLDLERCAALPSPPQGAGAATPSGAVFLALQSGMVVRMDPVTGQITGALRASDRPLTTDVLFDGNRVLVGDADGRVAHFTLSEMPGLEPASKRVKAGPAAGAWWAGALGGRMRNGRAEAEIGELLEVFVDGFEARVLPR